METQSRSKSLPWLVEKCQKARGHRAILGVHEKATPAFQVHGLVVRVCNFATHINRSISLHHLETRLCSRSGNALYSVAVKPTCLRRAPIWRKNFSRLLPTAFSFLRLPVQSECAPVQEANSSLASASPLAQLPSVFPSQISLQNRWTGTNGQGTLGALSAELLARRFSRKSLENLHEPGGIRTHVLPRGQRSNPALHHVQLFRLSANSRREENRAEQRGDSRASFDRRSNSSPHHPGFLDQPRPTSRSAQLVSLRPPSLLRYENRQPAYFLVTK